MSLNSERFEKLLSALAADREAAGRQYEVVRLKLVKYFEIRMCPSPDDLADETIDRVARRLWEGERLESSNLMRYVYGVARNVFLESGKTDQRRGPWPVAGDPAEAALEGLSAEQQLDCFRECLNEQLDEPRGLLLRYYQYSGRQKIDTRLELARELGIPLNALRIRIHRIKADLQRCMDKCMRRHQL